MPHLRLEPLPPRAARSDVLRLLTEQGGIDRRLVGRIDLQGRLAVVEVPDGWATRLARALDGADLDGRRLRAWCDAAAPANEDHFSRPADLLELESQTEARQALERAQRLAPEEADRGRDTPLHPVLQ